MTDSDVSMIAGGNGNVVVGNGVTTPGIAANIFGGNYVIEPYTTVIGTGNTLNGTTSSVVIGTSNNTTMNATSSVQVGIGHTDDGTNNTLVGSYITGDTVAINGTALGTAIEFSGSGSVTVGGGDGFYGCYYLLNDIDFSIMLGTGSDKPTMMLMPGTGPGTYGRVLVGTKTDNATDKLQVAGSIKATQFKLSALNTTPATSGATGKLGDIRIDANYIYVCVATNTWKRSAISTW